MKILIVAAVLVAILLWYALSGREWLRMKPWAQGFFAFVEPIEIVLFKKSTTILFARMKVLTGVLLTMLTQLGSIDLTPLMPYVPDKYEPYVRVAFNLLPMLITVMGMADEKLRYETTKPIELVAVAEKDMPPEVTDALIAADAAKSDAVAAVTATKAA